MLANYMPKGYKKLSVKNSSQPCGFHELRLLIISVTPSREGGLVGKRTYWWYENHYIIVQGFHGIAPKLRSKHYLQYFRGNQVWLTSIKHSLSSFQNVMDHMLLMTAGQLAFIMRYIKSFPKLRWIGLRRVYRTNDQPPANSPSAPVPVIVTVVAALTTTTIKSSLPSRCWPIALIASPKNCQKLMKKLLKNWIGWYLPNFYRIRPAYPERTSDTFTPVIKSCDKL